MMMCGRLTFPSGRSGSQLLTRAARLIWLTAVFPLSLHAESFLISPTSASGPYELQTSAGKFPVQASVINPPAKLALLVHRDSLTDTEWREAQARILKLHGA